MIGTSLCRMRVTGAPYTIQLISGFHHLRHKTTFPLFTLEPRYNTWLWDLWWNQIDNRTNGVIVVRTVNWFPNFRLLIRHTWVRVGVVAIISMRLNHGTGHIRGLYPFGVVPVWLYIMALTRWKLNKWQLEFVFSIHSYLITLG